MSNNESYNYNCRDGFNNYGNKFDNYQKGYNNYESQCNNYENDCESYEDECGTFIKDFDNYGSKCDNYKDEDNHYGNKCDNYKHEDNHYENKCDDYKESCNHYENKCNDYHHEWDNCEEKDDSHEDRCEERHNHCKNDCEKYVCKARELFERGCNIQRKVECIGEKINEIIGEVKGLKKLADENYNRANCLYYESEKLYEKAERLFCQWSKCTNEALRCYRTSNCCCIHVCEQLQAKTEQLYNEIQCIKAKARRLFEQAVEFEKKASCYEDQIEEKNKEIARLRGIQANLRCKADRFFDEAQKYGICAMECYKRQCCKH